MKRSHFKLLIPFLLLTLGGCPCKKKSPTNPGDPIHLPPSIYDEIPAWSPDGLTIAYVRIARDTTELKNGQYQIWFVNPDGSNKRYFRAGDAPSWSPDSRKICFLSGGQIYSISVNGDSLAQLTDSGSNYFPSWSKDGLKIAYDSNLGESSTGFYSIWVMDWNGGNKRKIAQWKREADWSPTNLEISVVGYPGDAYTPEEIYKVDINSGQVTRLTYDQFSDHSPAWSLDGRKIAYGSDGGIRLINPDGSNSSLLPTLGSGEPNWLCQNPSWSPDGRQIVYNKQYLWIINADGSGNHQITN